MPGRRRLGVQGILHLNHDTEDSIPSIHLTFLGILKLLTDTMDLRRRIEISDVLCTVTDNALWRQLITNPNQAARVEIKLLRKVASKKIVSKASPNS
jgi:hypothetical protein